MPKLDTFLSQWRQSMLAASPHLTPATLDELESHLRESIATLVHEGVPEAEAGRRAVAMLGAPASVAAEFRKLIPAPWLPLKFVTGLGIAVALVTTLLVLFRPFSHPGGGVLLAVHVFSVTLGYTFALLLGLLGTCFILQRAWSGFPPHRAAPLSRATLRLASISTGLTAVAIVLGMLWSERAWGRFWGWDAKEVGALCIVVWMTGFLAAHHLRWVTARGLFIASVLGSNVVLLGWFGSARPRGLHFYGWPGYAWMLLFGAIAANVLVAALGFAPARWLRRRGA